MLYPNSVPSIFKGGNQVSDLILTLHFFALQATSEPERLGLFTPVFCKTKASLTSESNCTITLEIPEDHAKLRTSLTVAVDCSAYQFPMPTRKMTNYFPPLGATLTLSYRSTTYSVDKIRSQIPTPTQQYHYHTHHGVLSRTITTG
ncbi:hypothetical protein WAI453_009628 [Rhynchosporium graminicola]